MRDLRSLSRLAAVALCLAGSAPATADEDASERLRKGVALFGDGEYLAAQQMMLNIERGELDDAERALRDEYIERAGVAINMVAKAHQEIEEALAALAGGDFDAAKALFESVLDNEYAPTGVREAAEQGLDDVAAERREAQRPHDPERVAQEDAAQHEPRRADPPSPWAEALTGDSSATAKLLTERGYAALDQGDLDGALEQFNRALTAVPGFPEALTGIERVRAHAEVESGAATDLLDRIRVRNRIRWQRVRASYRDAAAEAREHVIGNQFDLAKQAVLRARQIVESGKEYAEPLARYESLRAEVESLARFVEDEARHHDELEIRRIRSEVARQDADRIAEQRRIKVRRVDALMDQAAQRQKNRDFEGAIDVLRQVVNIDPLNDQARWKLDSLDEMWSFLRQREARAERSRQAQGVLADAEETKIPWHENLTYPKNWIEIISRPDRVVSGQEYLLPEDQAIRSRMGAKIPVSFDDIPLGEVFETLSDTQQLNLSVVWSDLELQGIDQDTPVTLLFQNDITVGKALDETLDQVGGGSVELGYVISEGIIKIATRDLLDRDTFVEVYDISDLLMRMPDFIEAPEVNLEQGGGGGGAGGGSAQQNPFQGGGGGGGGGDDQDNRTRRERAEEIVELIRETIEPESWRSVGGTDASIRALEANLVVTQTASGHEQIADLLTQLRQERAIQIAVEARFLTVTANYLEEMGIDLDIILNQGNAGFDRVNGLDDGTALLLPRSFSQLGFTPAVPAVGVALDPRGIPTTAVPNIRQPFGNVGTVPAPSSFGGTSGSRMTPVPILNNVLDLTSTESTSIPGSLGGLESAALQVFGSFLDNIQVDFLLRATQADRRGSTMSAPRLVLSNGQRAWVGVLREQAYVQTVQPVVDETAVAQQPQVNQILTGSVLDVQATVTADKRYVTMTLRPGVATLDGIQEFPFSGGAAGTAAGGGFIQLPSRQLQVVRTTVTVPDGGTLLIGGMKTTEEVEVEAGVPVLSKIPVLKRLYSNRSLVKDEQVLLILVKPTVIIAREAEEEAFPTFGSRG